MGRREGGKGWQGWARGITPSLSRSTPQSPPPPPPHSLSRRLSARPVPVGPRHKASSRRRQPHKAVLVREAPGLDARDASAREKWKRRIAATFRCRRDFSASRFRRRTAPRPHRRPWTSVGRVAYSLGPADSPNLRPMRVHAPPRTRCHARSVRTMPDCESPTGGGRPERAPWRHRDSTPRDALAQLLLPKPPR